MNEKGFTIIELIITLSVIGIILALTFFRLDADMFYMDKMAEEFVMDVRYVQTESMKNPDSPYIISIDEGNGCYCIANGASEEKRVQFKNRFKISYSNIEKVLSFSYDGAPLNAGALTITDTKTHKTKDITIVPSTGRTAIVD